MARPREKVILFIVEGTSDMHALERPIMNLLQAHGSEYKVRFLPATTDITSDFRNNPDNILDVIAKHYFKKDNATLIESHLLSTSGEGQEILRQFVEQGMTDTRAQVIAIIVPQYFDSGLKGTLRYLARISGKKVLFIGLDEISRLLEINSTIDMT